VGEVHPASSKGHRFVLVTTDYFTKWIEVVPLKNMTHRGGGNKIHRGAYYTSVWNTTNIDNQSRAMFMSHQFREFAEALKIKLLNSSPYYAQANGQAESSNKVLIKLIKKKIDEHPRRWYEVLSEALWAHRTSKYSAMKVTLFELVYGQEVVLPIEINLQTLRVIKQDILSAKEYTEGMMDRVDELPEGQFRA
jgi:transposase InsO family protein